MFLLIIYNLICVGVLFFCLSDSAYAYIDPGTGSMLLQVLLAGAAGVAVAFKLVFRRFRNIFSFKKPGAISKVEQSDEITKVDATEINQ
ncbi:MAG TPA: hypothetical protein PKD37_03900 [Oligoflexia bacterium]|nr:hypothetical protein [Oligoflexia bacterium]HMP27111.1 hypothetical protein [Oligoflexia bacterium]